jgi:phospholipid/cholesterol/gamma-HCH transport system permease protein
MEASSHQWDEALRDVPGYPRLKVAGEMGRMGLGVLRTAVTPPFPWLGECVREASLALRRCVLPAFLSMAAFGIGLACVFVGGIIRLLGTADRLGGGINLGFTREPGVWVAIMILSGVAGSAMTADLGARKIRDELDALKVLAVDERRGLVVPRVIALTIVGPLLGTFTLFTAWISTYVATGIAFGSSTLTSAGFLETFKEFVSPPDFVNFLLKTALAGFFVGVVSCYKGINSSGGAEGVGRAVNQAVLISFFGVWIISYVFNTVFLSLFPGVSILRG